MPNKDSSDSAYELSHKRKTIPGLASSLDRRRRQCGDIFWFKPSLFRRDVLVVYNMGAIQGILDEESWIFSKAIEPWFDRKYSKKSLDRLLSDGLLMADGNHHHKHASLLASRLSSKPNLRILDERLKERLKEHICSGWGIATSGPCERLSSVMLQEFLEVYYGLGLNEAIFRKLIDYSRQAWLENQQEVHCPFQWKRRFELGASNQNIDDLRSMLRLLVDQSLPLEFGGQADNIIQITNKAVVDEVLTISVGFIGKMTSLITSVSDHVLGIENQLASAIGLEWDNAIEDLTLDCLTSQCPNTAKCLIALLGKCDASQQILKRVAVCDAVICGHQIPETTEIWIPTWHEKQLLFFGLGKYACKGKDLSLLAASRIMQRLCSQK